MSRSLSTLQPRSGAIQVSALMIAAVLLSGCASHQIQTTSGKKYLARHDALQTTASFGPTGPTSKSAQTVEAPSAAGGAASFDQALRHVANIEPAISFPARIGIARVGCSEEAACGGLVPISPGEGEAWSQMATNLGPSYGSFVPINPLAYDIALTEAGKTGLDVSSLNGIDKIRLAAARQHLDTVIIYEATSTTETQTSLLTLADLTIIGAFILPSKKIDAEGYAAAIMLDPVTGYPYGQAEATAEGDSQYASTIGRSRARDDAGASAAVDAVTALAEETEKAIRDLRSALAEEAAGGNS